MTGDGDQGGPTGPVGVLTRSFAILDAILTARRGLSVTAVAEATALPRSTAHRLLTELQEHDLVVATPGGYRIGPGALRLARVAQSEYGGTLRAVVQALAAEVNENVDLAVLVDSRVVVVDQVASAQRLQAVTEVGREFPAHASGIGKVLLAARADEDASALLPAELRAYTPATTTSREALLHELAGIRRSGLAYDRGEHDEGISSVATALRSAGGTTYAVSVVAPTQRFRTQHRRYAAALLALRERPPARAGSPRRRLPSSP